ncbi:MAG: glycosyltransferase family 4 protein [Treponemataceae bacterium]|nr:glycosyltransferase family 4 protein [Treponemataceae bacterium]
MKVGIDTFGCGNGKSGISSYLRSLMTHWEPAENTEIELFGLETDRFAYVSGGSHIAYEAVHISSASFAVKWWHIFRLSRFIRRRKYDVVLYPAATRICPITPLCPAVPVVLDLLSSAFEKKNTALYKRAVLSCLNRAPLVIATSNAIKKNMVSYGIDADKIEVVHTGLDQSLFYPHTELSGDTVVIQPFSIKRPFILYASRLDGSQKKHRELIEAFGQFKKKTGLPHRLVLAGENGSGTEAVRKAASESEYASDIFITGYFPHANLPELYSCADLFVFPATQEGVGSPVLEAMATGVPCAVSKSGALTEIAGDNVLYFDSDNVAEMAEVIEKGITDEKLRNQLIEGEADWIKRFSWERTVEKIVDVLQRADILSTR